jgi:hypothetical protein
MVGRGKTITVLIGGLALCATIRADMVPLASADTVSLRSSQACLATDLQATDSSSQSVTLTGLTDLGSLSLGFLPEPTAEGRKTVATQSAQILADKQNSLNLCLYALLGLGLCRSAPFVKKLHLGVIPDWYHSGGPYQVGNSFAISPDCLSPTPVCCFIQPDSPSATQASQPQFHRGDVVSLWRKSQFTPTVLASRGPPSLV